MKVLLDTDIGNDIDDAVCLAYLLSQPDCELLGITTVTGEPVQRAMLASALCRAAGKNDIPIFPGCERPLLTEIRQPRAPQSGALVRWDHQTTFPPAYAVEFMRQTIRQHPGEITLLTIGPLTNIGLLFAIDPEIPSMLKGLVMMAGVFTNKQAGAGPLEWNVINDAYAAAIVYRAQVAIHRSIGLDVTMQVQMPMDEVRQRFKAPLLKPVLDYSEVWFKERPKITFHDPLAAATLFNNDLCTFQRGQVEVELMSPRLLGYTAWKAGDASSPHEVALAVKPDTFFAEYFSVFE